MTYKVPESIKRDVAISACRALIKFIVQNDPSLGTECQQMLAEPDDSVSIGASPFNMVVIEGMHSVGQKLVMALSREGVDTLNVAGAQHMIDQANARYAARSTAPIEKTQVEDGEQE